MLRRGLLPLVMVAALLTVPAWAQPLPWADAAPLPNLPTDFANAVNPVVRMSHPDMGRVVYTRDLVYTDRDNPNIRMDIYQPPGSRAGERRPVVLFIHGGTDTRSQPKNWGLYQSWGRLVAAHGLVAVTFTHSLSFPQTRVREGAADVAAAIAFVRANAARFGIDPDRLCLIAFSAGGPTLAPYLRGAPEEIRCLAGYYPFMDIRQSEHHQRSESPETLPLYSNVVRVAGEGRTVPLLLVRAGADEIPTLLDSVDRFVAAALAADYPLTLLNIPGAPHGFENQRDDPRTQEIIRSTLRFLTDHLFEERQSNH
jgi:acetyl esterase/lipase